ncbi:MAG: serine/threonine protein kinase, partial [Planctomycetales bacterium]|nr:serine/threonine protein kinase [Planctomycetales bacterium]
MTDAKDIFLQAIECTSPDERTQLIDDACGDNADLRSRVEALLAAHDDPDSYLERPAARFDITATHDGSGSNLSDSSSSHHGRFLPGTKIDGRYRIVSMLGRGGMGEVYRADDLRLGQTVALKFLPPELAKDAKRLEYFHNEVRLARQIAHPNVCRVYDIGEVDGQHFISMEYIDGEDLKTLLHRIGRLPNDKGSQIAQQLCAGLAAAHARGVLHRDLKPANIMIDGQGHARITDFGLATVSGDGENVIGMSGTPAYMAPEQLLRGQTSVQSDIYSLGLILYEAIVGKPAHVAESLDQLRQFHEESSGPRKPSSIEGSVDPVIERAICRCLEHSPEDRPKSVSELSLHLPGGDPLAAALAGGELPSPELLAASGESGVITKAFGLCLLAVTIVGIVLIAFLSDRVVNVNRVPSGKSPEFLKYRGRDIIEQLGYGDAIDDVAVGIHETKSRSLRFCLRTSPATFQDTRRTVSVSNYVWFDGTPWHTVSMTGVELDLNGNVWQFRAVPPDSKLMTDAEPFSWDSVVTKNAFGLDLSELKRATWKIAPPVAFDHLESWDGTLPGTQERVYVQAASFQGRPVYWRRFSEVEFERASTIS